MILKTLKIIFLGFWTFTSLSAQEEGRTEMADLEIWTHSLDFGVVEDNNYQLRGVEGGGRRAVDIEVVHAILNELGVSKIFKTIPFNRGLRKVQTEDNIVYFNVLRTPAREDTVKWVGPLQSYSAFFYGKKEIAENIRRLDQAKAVEKICLIRGDSAVAKYKALGFDNLLEVSNKFQCWDLLSKGTVDLIALTDLEPLLLNDPSQESKYARSKYFEENKGYIALSRNINDQVVNLLQHTLDTLKSSGDYSLILNKYRLK